MRIVCISDTHNRLDDVSIPEGDVVVHAGDLSGAGNVREVFQEYGALSELPHRKIIAIPGNRDLAFQAFPDILNDLTRQFPRVETLIDQGTTLNGLHVFGSPWQPWHENWAYNFAPGLAGKKEAKEKWSEIPDNTTILITHGPPYGILDKTLSGEYAGCTALKKRIKQLSQLALHIFGHIHEGYGIHRAGDVLFVNASTCDARYRPIQPPIIVDFSDGRFKTVRST